MFLNNQNQGQTQRGSGSQGKFQPMSRTTTQMGTTVNYSLNHEQNISAHNTNQWSSGQFAPMSNNFAPGYNTFLGYNNYPSYSSQVFAMGQNSFVSGALIQPSIDISETSSDVIIAAHVPNLLVSDINLSTTENSVTITATGWLNNQNVSLNRTVALPTSIRSEAVDATLQSGVLEVRCPKIERSHRNRVIVKSDQLDRPDTIVE